MDPWSKVDYSRLIREALMAVEKLAEINPPSGRVSGHVRLAIPILEFRRRRNSGEYHGTECLTRVYETRGKYRHKGGTNGGPTPSAAWPPGRGVAPLWLSFGLHEASELLIFYIFFLDF